MARLGHTGFLFKDRSLTFNDNGKSALAFTLGSGSYIVSSSYETINIRKNVLIGKFCSLAHEIIFAIGMNHNYNCVSTYPFKHRDMLQQVESYKEKFANAKFPIKKYNQNSNQIVIGNDVWIGRGATIMGGVKIGSGAVIGANAVVAKNIPPYAIAVGNPARVIKYRFDEETVKKFMAVKWWNWDLNKIYDNVPIMGDAEKFLETHYKPELEYIPPYQNRGGGAD